MKDFFQSSLLSRMIVVLGILLVALLIFWAGTAVGERRSEFAGRWDDNYTGTFGGPGSPFAPGMNRDNTVAANGAFGTVVGVNSQLIAVKGPNEAEKIVVIGPDTVIRQFHSLATTSDIKVGQTMIAIGDPDSQGRISATFIRIVPPPAQNQ